MALYLAYGSNLHPARLQARLGEVSLLGCIRLKGVRLNFHKRGADDSGKADLSPSPNTSISAYGALYQLSPAQLELLDSYEGGYYRQTLDCRFNNEVLPVITYRAEASRIHCGLQPFTWYRDLIVAGGTALRFPAAYLEEIRRTASKKDPKPARAHSHERLLTQLHPIKEAGSLSWGEVQSFC